MPQNIQTPNIEEITKILNYDEITGNFIWKIHSQKCRVGAIAGSKSKIHGYIQIGINNKVYTAHRIAWKLHYNEEPPTFIDHINGNRSDNRIKNLRSATNAENSRNGKKRKNNKSGFKGVHFAKKINRFVASIAKNGKSYYLGTFVNPESAHEAYCKKAKELHGQFANFG